jgi:chaperonin GroES
VVQCGNIEKARVRTAFGAFFVRKLDKEGAKMGVKPLFDRVLLRAEPEQKTDCGVILPRGSDERSQIMRVVEVGECKSTLKIGDRVVVAKYAGTEVNFGGEKFTLVCEYDILASIQM